MVPFLRNSFVNPSRSRCSFGLGLSPKGEKPELARAACFRGELGAEGTFSFDLNCFRISAFLLRLGFNDHGNGSKRANITLARFEP